MAENPIRTSDLFEDDGVIQRVIEQLERLMAIIRDMQGQVSASARSIKAETQKTTSSQQQHREALQQNAREVENLTKANRALLEAKKPIARELEKIKAQTQVQTKLNKEAAKAEAQRSESVRTATQETMRLSMENKKRQKEQQLEIKINQSAEGSYNRLSAQYSKLKLELNAMSFEQRHNTEHGREMEMQSKRLYEEMNRMQMATGKHQLKVGSYTEAIRESNMSLAEMRKELRMLREMPVSGKSHAEVEDINRAIGELDDSMKKLQMQQEAYGMDNMEMIAGASRAATGAVGALAGAFNVLGIESEKLRGVQQNMQSMLVITQGLDAIEQAYHKRIIQTMAAKGKKMALTIRDTVVRKYNAAATWLQVRAQRQQAKTTITNTAATGAASTATTIATAATTAWAVAVRGFSRAVYGIPVFGWLLAIIGAIIGVVVVLIRHWERVVDLFRRVGRIFGLVSKETGHLERELNKATQAQRRLNLEMELSTAAIERYEKAERRRIDLLRASGAATEVIEKAEKELLETLLRNAKHRTEIARQQMLEQTRVLSLMREMNKSEEELAEQREKLEKAREHYSNMREAVDEIEHSLDVHHANEQRRIRERTRAEQAAAREKLMSEKRATLELAVMRAKQAQQDAKTDKEREEAALRYMNIRQQQIRELAEMELETVEEPKQRELIMEQANKKIQQIADEHYQWLYDREKERFDLLLDLTQSEEQKRLTELRRVYEDRRALAGDDKELLLAIEQWYADELESIERKRNELREVAERERRIAEREAAEQALVDRLALEESAFNVTARTQAEQQRFRLQQDLEYYTERLKLQREYGDLMTETEVEIVENLILQTQRKIDEMGKTRPEDFWEMVGIKMSENTRALVRDSVQFALDNISMIIQARQQQADAAVKASEQEVDSARKAYEEELKLAKDGHANRLEIAERELEQAEKNKERAADMAERERARQARLESLAQSGNLLVASTKILAQYGIPMALPFLAMMWSTFYAQRRRARQAAAETYGEGHFEVIGGGSHASGNDTPLNIDKRNRRVERGEAFAVFNKKATGHYGAGNLQRLVDGMNRQNIDVHGFVAQDISMIGNTELSIFGLQEGIERLVAQGEEKTYVDNKGRLVKQRNNTTRIYV